jgi:transposase
MTRILIVEDDRATSCLLQGLVESWGYASTVVGDGKGALAAFGGAVTPRVVLLDWGLPDVNGLEVCLRIRALRLTPQPQILMVTANATATDVTAALTAGADGYLLKPFNAAELCTRLAAIADLVDQEDRIAALTRAAAARLSESEIRITAGKDRRMTRMPAGIEMDAVAPHPEVLEKGPRRTFSEEYRLRILKEADACTKPGELGFLLRREGLDTSYLAAWQWQHDRGEPLTGTVRGRGRAPDPIDPRAKQLEIENRRLQLKLARAEMAVTRRRKLSDLWRLVRRVPRRCARIWRFAVDWSFGGARVN